MQRQENNRTKYTGLTFVLALLLWIGTVQASESEEIVLYDNLHVSPFRTATISPGLDEELGQQFFTGEFGNVASVSILMRRRGTPGGQFTVEIWDDNGSPFPGKKVGTLGSIELNTVPTVWSLVTIEGLVDGLNPHTPYWVYVYVPNVTFTSGTFSDTFTQSDEGTFVTGNPPHIAVEWEGDHWRSLNSYYRMKVTSAVVVRKWSHFPNPTLGQADVHRDVVLEWSPGITDSPIDGHIVYLDNSFNDVNDGIGGVTLSDPTYDPGRLDFDTTYYWRVDQVTGPPDGTVYQGNIWSFTTEPAVYLINNISASASGSLDDTSVPERSVDGSGLIQDRHNLSPTTMWFSDTVPAWIEYEFDRAYKLSEMFAWNANPPNETEVGMGAKDVTIEHSTNGAAWTVLGDVTQLDQASSSDTTFNTRIDFGETTAQFVRLTIHSNYGGGPQTGLSEVKFLHKPVHARSPEPADGAMESALDTILTWRPGREAGSHQVYFSDAMDSVVAEAALLVSTDNASIDLSDQHLKYGTTYYWKVNEVNDLESPPIHVGDLWRFQSPEFLSVDDMERYRDKEGLEIWQHWVDGVGDETNGSIVGNENDAEKEHVVEGRQSLPLLYDHEQGMVSAATRTFDPPLDWVRGDPQVLSLFFLGDPTEVRNRLTNDPAPLYVEITDSAGQIVHVDHPDPAATHITTWTEWLIPISDLNSIDLSSVQAITLGIGSTGQAAKGKMFFDNIRVGTPRSQK